MARIPAGNYQESEMLVAIAQALNEHFNEFASDKRLTDTRLTVLEAEVKAMNGKLDKLLEQLSPQTTPKRDLRKPSDKEPS